MDFFSFSNYVQVSRWELNLAYSGDIQLLQNVFLTVFLLLLNIGHKITIYRKKTLNSETEMSKMHKSAIEPAR